MFLKHLPKNTHLLRCQIRLKSDSSAVEALPWMAQADDTMEERSEQDSIYKRPLSEKLVSFSSTEGKKLFREALNAGYMENYFPLAE
jgi:hypothetical protein